MRSLVVAVLVAGISAPAFAGGMEPPVMEDEVVVSEAPASSGSVAGAAVIVPLLAIGAIVAATR